jgi:hypothetical protein
MPSISSSSKPKHSKSQRTKHPLLDHAPIQSSPTGRNGPRGRLTSSHARLSSRQNPHRRRVRRTTQPSQPAVSSLGGFRTPAPVHVERFVTGRHPKTFTKTAADLTTSGGGTCSDSGRHGRRNRRAVAEAREALSVGRRPAEPPREHATRPRTSAGIGVRP